MEFDSMIQFRATMPDLQHIKEFYSDVISKTEDMEKYVRWQDGVYPDEEGIRDYISQGAMYLFQKQEQLVGVMAVTMEQAASYRRIEWEIEAKDDQVAVIHMLGVKPKFQGQGIGKQMIEAACEMARKQGKRAVRLDALASNQPAHRLYEREGFRFRGTQNLFAENTGWTDFYFFEKKI